MVRPEVAVISFASLPCGVYQSVAGLVRSIVSSVIFFRSLAQQIGDGEREREGQPAQDSNAWVCLYLFDGHDGALRQTRAPCKRIKAHILQSPQMLHLTKAPFPYWRTLIVRGQSWIS
ncbi:hypothetical protein X743_19565 [Mesorhizobium sp. LNHC252B00]|nr:hypothetical protein X743_19565 [Mesorhizobium sp. LNHC252B00]